MPFQRPSRLATSPDAESMRESSAYWMNAAAISHGNNAGKTPILASAAVPVTTNAASAAWSAKPPNGVSSP